MTDATQSLYAWWNLMASMQAKYGTPPDIEDKPEWPALEQAQVELMEELHKISGSTYDLLFESVQAAMFHVLGMDNEVSLTIDQASQIVQVTIEMAVTYESSEAQRQGLMN